MPRHGLTLFLNDIRCFGISWRLRDAGNPRELSGRERVKSLFKVSPFILLAIPLLYLLSMATGLSLPHLVLTGAVFVVVLALDVRAWLDRRC